MEAGTIELLRRLIRGDEEPRDTVQALGVSVTGSAGSLALEVPSELEGTEFDVADLAHGLLVHWSRGTSLREWASLVLTLDAIQFVGAESPEEERLIEALWAASAGEPVDEAVLALARALDR